MRGARASLTGNQSRLKVYAPEMRGWGQEFHTNADASVTAFPEIDDSAFLLFLGFRIYQNEHFAVVDFVA